MNVVYLGRYNKNNILSGPEKVARRIFDNISESEKSFFIEYFFDGKKFGIFKKLFGKELVCSVNNSDVFRFGLFPLLLKLTVIKPKIIHIITFERFALISFVYKLFFQVKIVYNMHGLIIYENKYFRKQNFFYNLKDRIIEKIYIKYSDIVLFLSRNFRSILGKYYKTEENKLKFIKNGVDYDFFNASKKRVFNKNNILKIIFIADIQRKEKGFLFLKKTIEMLKFSVELYVVDKKENKIFFENTLVKVFCLDKMDKIELSDFLVDKDIFISASNYEPFSIVGVECMAAGAIPVLSKETGASELIVDGVNGFIFNYGESNKLIDILKKLNDNYELRKSVSKEAMKIYDILNWQKIKEEYIDIYNSLLK